MPATTYKPMTKPQFDYLCKLIRQAHPASPVQQASEIAKAAGHDFYGASNAINALKLKASNTPPSKVMPSYVPPFGSYLVGGLTYTIKKPKYAGGNITVLMDGTYFGTVGFLKANALIETHLNSASVAHAAVLAYAKATGKCGVCHTKLTDPKSIAAGIGPVCAKKYGY